MRKSLPALKFKSDTGTADLQTEVSFTLPRQEKEPFQLWLRCSEPVLKAAPEMYVAATLLPAMKLGTSVEPPGPIDPMFAGKLATIQDIFTTWFTYFQRVDVYADTKEEREFEQQDRKTATFFTGGVDSFYTLLKHEAEVDVLVYVHGFDVSLNDTALRKQISQMLRRVADHFGKEVIELETNIRNYSDPIVKWPDYHGAALSMTGLALQPLISRCYIPSSFPYNHLRLWGSHPLLDPCWSTAGLAFLHDGCEASRLEKCRSIARSDMAMSQLRVCWLNTDSKYNCGKCEKCTRTMIQLLAAEALGRCTSFPGSLNPAVISRSPEIQSTIRRLDYQYHPSLKVLRERGTNPALVSAIEAALAGPTTGQRLWKWGSGIKHVARNGMQEWLGSEE